MPLDGLALQAVCQELDEKLREARIDRIFQPSQLSISMELRQRGAVRRLYLAAHPQFARVQLTESKRANPAKPPHFCLFLRKFLEGARVLQVTQPGYERLLELEIQGRDDLGDPALYRLIVEMMGKYSNIILCNAEGRILEAIKHVGPTQSRYREILPGAAYLPPPAQGKEPPEQWQPPKPNEALPEGEREIAPWLLSRLEGFSLGAVNALLAGCALPGNLKASYLRLEDWLDIQANLFDLLQQRQEGMLYLHGEGSPAELSAFPWPKLPAGSWHPASEALDLYFMVREDNEQLQGQRHRLNTVLKGAIDKGTRRKFALEEDLSSALDCEHLRVWGELLKMAPEPGKRLEAIELVNYYDEELGTIIIPLDQRLTVAENSQSFFKRYGKHRTGERLIGEQLATLERELSYLLSVQVAADQALTLSDLKEIVLELTEQGYLQPDKPPPNSRGRPAAKDAPLPPLSLDIEGVEVLVGRNNRQNDELTWRLARPDDTWLHTKDIPGSHLLIRSANPSNSVLEKAARLAAWFSQARESGLVPVDITLRRHVRKPRGARPGYVIYSNQRTVYVTPSDEPLQEPLQE